MEASVIGRAERFFRDSDYWKAWTEVPDWTVDIDYALEAVEPHDRAVLDAPCGRGRLLKAVGARAPRAALYGLDVNDEMVARSRRDVPGATVQVGSIYALPFRDQSFDAVLCNEAFMHFDDPNRALAELCRVARARVYFSATTRRQLNTMLRALGVLGTADVPHFAYNIEELTPLLPESFRWRIRGGIVFGRKALRVSHRTHRQLHRAFGRLLPQPILRTFGQSLFAYGWRKVSA
jgi:SAM-dependent methyltransferase